MEQAIPSRPDAEKALQRIFSYDNGFIKVDTGKNRKASFQALSDEHRQILSFMDLGFKRHLIDDIPPLEITEEEYGHFMNHILKAGQNPGSAQEPDSSNR